MTNTPFRRGAKLSVPISSSVIAAMVMALAVQGAAAAPARTADRRLVAGLRTARAASQKALSSVSPVSPTGAKKAAAELSRAIEGSPQPTMPRGARSERFDAVVRTAVRQGKGLVRQARSDVVGGRYAAARVKLRRADTLTSAALSDFGVPLRKPSRVRHNPRERYHPGDPHPPYETGGRYTGLSALVGGEL